MTVGQSFQMPLGDAMKTIPVTMKVEGREEVQTPAGKFQTLRVEPTADAGVVKNRGNIWIWYTDDDKHMPVQMRARFFWGTITFRLTSVDQNRTFPGPRTDLVRGAITGFDTARASAAAGAACR